MWATAKPSTKTFCWTTFSLPFHLLEIEKRRENVCWGWQGCPTCCPLGWPFGAELTHSATQDYDFRKQWTCILFAPLHFWVLSPKLALPQLLHRLKFKVAYSLSTVLRNGLCLGECQSGKIWYLKLNIQTCKDLIQLCEADLIVQGTKTRQSSKKGFPKNSSLFPHKNHFINLALNYWHAEPQASILYTYS